MEVSVIVHVEFSYCHWFARRVVVILGPEAQTTCSLHTQTLNSPVLRNVETYSW